MQVSTLCTQYFSLQTPRNRLPIMGLYDDLCDLWKIAFQLREHESTGVQTCAGRIEFLVAVIESHRPDFSKRVYHGAFTWFSGEALRVIESRIESLKRLLAPARVLLRYKEDAPKKVINRVEFSPDVIDQFYADTTTLYEILTAERLKGYVGYILSKLRRSKLWSQSIFREATWAEVACILSKDSASAGQLNHLVNQLCQKFCFDPHVVKTCIRLGTNTDHKYLYIASLIQHQKIRELSWRVSHDEILLEYPMGVDTLEIRAYRLAFMTFRYDWFEKGLSCESYRLTDKARRWLATESEGRLELRRM